MYVLYIICQLCYILVQCIQGMHVITCIYTPTPFNMQLGAHSTYIKPLSGSTSDLPSAVLDKDQQYVQEALKEDDLFSFAHQIAIGMVW